MADPAQVALLFSLWMAFLKLRRVHTVRRELWERKFRELMRKRKQRRRRYIEYQVYK